LKLIADFALSLKIDDYHPPLLRLPDAKQANAAGSTVVAAVALSS
jgi:hypothetical protein